MGLAAFLPGRYERLQPFMWLCAVCKRQYRDDAEALKCYDSHPKDKPPTNEDR